MSARPPTATSTGSGSWSRPPRCRRPEMTERSPMFPAIQMEAGSPAPSPEQPRPASIQVGRHVRRADGSTWQITRVLRSYRGAYRGTVAEIQVVEMLPYPAMADPSEQRYAY